MMEKTAEMERYEEFRSNVLDPLDLYTEYPLSLVEGVLQHHPNWVNKSRNLKGTFSLGVKSNDAGDKEYRVIVLIYNSGDYNSISTGRCFGGFPYEPNTTGAKGWSKSERAGWLFKVKKRTEARSKQ